MWKEFLFNLLKEEFESVDMKEDKNIHYFSQLIVIMDQFKEEGNVEDIRNIEKALQSPVPKYETTW